MKALPHHALSEVKQIPAQFGYAAVGLALLLAGRRLFWLFIGAIGFVAATHAAETLLPPENHDLILIVGVVAGILGALLAIFLQKFAIGLAGAVAGAYYGKLLLDLNDISGANWEWIAIIVAAIIGAILMHFVFKWTLIIFSAVAGAHLLTETWPLTPQVRQIAFVVLVIIGVVVQARQLKPRTND